MTIDDREAESPTAKLWRAPVAARLGELAAGLAQRYRSAQPFPHVIIDDFLPADVLDRVIEAYPKPGEVDWQSIDPLTRRSSRLLALRRCPPPCGGCCTS